MAAQHLPRDLVRPSSGLKELSQAMKKDWSLAYQFSGLQLLFCGATF